MEITYHRPNSKIKYARTPLAEQIIHEEKTVNVNPKTYCVEQSNGSYVTYEALDEFMSYYGGWERKVV